MSDPLDPLQSYFDGEKQTALCCLALGLVAGASAVFLGRAAGSFRAMAVPVALVGVLQIAIGVGLYLRTDPQVAALRAELAAEPAAGREKELARMQRVNRNFGIVEIAEATLLLIGLGLALFMRSRPAVMAVGMGILVQASVMLVFDLFAEQRARVYTAWLRQD